MRKVIAGEYEDERDRYFVFLLNSGRRLLERLYDIQPSLDASDPLGAAREVLHRLPRRALVVMITNSRDEDWSGLDREARLLRRRHVLMVAGLRESALDRSLKTEIRDLAGVLRLHAVHGWLAARRHHRERLHHLGVEILDLLPAQLPRALVERYLAISRAGRL